MENLLDALTKANRFYTEGKNRLVARTIMDCPDISDDLKDLAIDVWYSCRKKDAKNLLKEAHHAYNKSLVANC